MQVIRVGRGQAVVKTISKKPCDGSVDLHQRINEGFVQPLLVARQYPGWCGQQKCHRKPNASLNYTSPLHNVEANILIPLCSRLPSLSYRLRAVKCPSDMIDQIGGWSTAGVGQSYGEGYGLKATEYWLIKLINRF